MKRYMLGRSGGAAATVVEARDHDDVAAAVEWAIGRPHDGMVWGLIGGLERAEVYIGHGRDRRCILIVKECPQ